MAGKRNGGRVRDARIRIDNLRTIMVCIQDNAPQDRSGELLDPYLGWLKALEADIERYEKWAKSSFGE